MGDSRAALSAAAAAECVGTAALVFFGCGSVMISGVFPAAMPASSIPLVFGGVVMAMIYSIGHISGAHINPAVSLSFALTGRFSVRAMGYYWGAQFLGAVSGVAALRLLFPDAPAYGATIPAVSVPLAFGWEAAMSFFLMFVIMAVSTGARETGVMAGVAIGATVALCAFVGGPVTGASMNPARSFGPAVFGEGLPALWIYLTAPAAGMVAGALTHEFIRVIAKGRE